MSLHPDRCCIHRYMGPPEEHPCCDGRGWKHRVVAGTEDDEIPDAREVYCECECGVERKRVEASK